MDYEKEYKKALERAREYHKVDKDNTLKIYAKGTMEYLFPVLKESEDEKMLREIKRYIKEQGDKPTGLPNGSVAVSDMLDWLEKQGEQKVSVVDFKAKDWYVSKVDGKIYNAKFMEKTPNNQARRLEIEKAAISATGIIEREEWFIKGAEWADENPFCVQIEKQGESSDKIHYWTEEEIEPIISDYLRGAEHYGGMISRLRCLKPKSLEKQGEKLQYWKPSEEQLEALDYAYNSCPDTEIGNRYEGVLETLIDDLYKLLKKQGEQKAINDTDEEIVNALKDTSVLDMIEPNPAWSEKDERMRNASIRACQYMVEHFENSTKDYEDAIDWFNSLKNRIQPQWKPSDEQMAHLVAAIEESDGNCILQSLYNDLKKL